jgi:hypothetical protein
MAQGLTFKGASALSRLAPTTPTAAGSCRLPGDKPGSLYEDRADEAEPGGTGANPASSSRER